MAPNYNRLLQVTIVLLDASSMKQSFLLNQDHSKEVITCLSQNQYSICRQSLTITNCLFASNVIHLILRRCFYLLFSKWIYALSVCLYKKSMGQRGCRSFYIAVSVIVENTIVFFLLASLNCSIILATLFSSTHLYAGI